MDVSHKRDLKSSRFLPEFTAMSYCHKNNIIIYPKILPGNQIVIILDYKGKIIRGKKIYQQTKRKNSKDEEWWEKIYSMYLELEQKLKSGKNASKKDF